MHDLPQPGNLHFPAEFHDRALAGWGVRRRRGDLIADSPTTGSIPLEDLPVETGSRVEENRISAAERPVEIAVSAVGEKSSDLSSSLVGLAQKVSSCEECSLSQTRTQTVFGCGDPGARLMFVGEAPGAEEDRRGEPFVGRAGQLLDRIITQGLKLTRDQIYIANVLKCRPPENRDPRPEEVQSCKGFLEKQIELVNPEMIVALGKPAAAFLTGEETSLKRLRGQSHLYKGIPVVVTYHPAFLLRQPQFKAECWRDLQQVITALDLPR
ncbi:MAG: uracil-DNA glycosylase [Planctomycetota bacterium]